MDFNFEINYKIGGRDSKRGRAKKLKFGYTISSPKN